MVDCTGGLALVLGGGAARAADQAGVLRGVARIAPTLAPAVLTRVSADAINTAFLASSNQPFAPTADALARGDEIERFLAP
ncbi:MAG: hypothetical protein FJ299_03275 [Planctomycetes bacterium]|nr:hypothetical protein [Planctomycetota bacterium]